MAARRNRWGAARMAGALALPFALGVAAAAVAATPARWSEDWCADTWQDGRAHACEVRDLPSATAPSVLRVDAGPNGGVEVAAGDRAGITGRARIEAWAATGAEARALIAQVRIVTTPGGFAARGPEPPAEGRGRRSASWNVQFRIEAPATQALDLATENGPLAVYGMRGRTVLDTENGPVAIERCGGDILARTQNGPLSVALAGSSWSGRGIDARSVNGPVSLSVPRDFDADLEFGTINGPWSGPRVAPAEHHRGYAHARLGTGGKPIAVTTENGPFAMDSGAR